METYNIYEAKTQLSNLVERAAKGEEIVIAKAGKPFARLMPLVAKGRKPHRVAGLGKGKMWVAPDAFSPEVDAAIAAEFENSEIFPKSQDATR